MRKVIITILLLSVMLFFSGCSVEDVNKIQFPSIETSGENNPFPSSVYEYNDEKGDDDCVGIFETIKGKVKTTWYKFTSGAWFDGIY